MKATKNPQLRHKMETQFELDWFLSVRTESQSNTLYTAAQPAQTRNCPLRKLEKIFFHVYSRCSRFKVLWSVLLET